MHVERKRDRASRVAEPRLDGLHVAAGIDQRGGAGVSPPMRSLTVTQGEPSRCLPILESEVSQACRSGRLTPNTRFLALGNRLISARPTPSPVVSSTARSN